MFIRFVRTECPLVFQCNAKATIKTNTKIRQLRQNITFAFSSTYLFAFRCEFSSILVRDLNCLAPLLNLIWKSFVSLWLVRHVYHTIGGLRNETNYKMSFLYILSLIAIVFQVCFITVAVGEYWLSDITFDSKPKPKPKQLNYIFPTLAAGLYYIAELVEEYTVLAKKTISWLVLIVTSVYVFFIFFDHLPWSMVLCGLAAQATHGLIMANFPYVKFASIPFIGAVSLLLVNHYLAFDYFTQNYFNFSEVDNSTRFLSNSIHNFI